MGKKIIMAFKHVHAALSLLLCALSALSGAASALTINAPPTVPAGAFFEIDAVRRLIPYAVGANAPSDSIGVEVSGSVPLLVKASDYYTGKITLSSEKIVFLIDGVAVSPVLSSPYTFTWDSTTVADGAHVLSLILVDGSSDLAGFRVLPTVLVVDNVPGPITGPQRIPTLGHDFNSTQLDSATPDWVNFPGGSQPPHPTAHPYPYQFVPPASTLANPSVALNDSAWVLEALTQANTNLYQGRPRYWQTKGGHVVAKQFYTQNGDTAESAALFVPGHAHYDGPRNDNSVSLYSTMIPEPNGPTWLGIDLAGRLFRVYGDGTVSTVAGPVTRRDVLPLDRKDTSISAAVMAQTQTEVKGSFEGSRLFKLPIDLTLDPRNHHIVYVADAGNHRIAKVDMSQSPAVVTTFAGKPDVAVSADGPIASATFKEPWSIVAADDGSLYVVDRAQNAIRKISADGTTVSTIVSASAGLTVPFAIRLDSHGNIILGEEGGSVKRIDAVTHAVTVIGTGCSASWVWLDVDRKGNVGPKDDIFMVCGTGGAGNTVMKRISADGSRNQFALGGSGALQQGNVGFVIDAHGHYPWVVAVDDEEGRIMTGGFGNVGLRMLRLTLPSDHIFPSFDTIWSVGGAGRLIFRRGTVAGFPFGSRPSFNSLLGETGHGYLGIQNFDDLESMTDAQLGAYIQAGMGGSVPRPEITGNDLRALIYHIRLHMLSALTNPPTPGPLDPDTTAPVIQSMTVTPIDAVTARVDWTTDEPTLGYVPFGPNSAYHRWSDLEDGYSTTHSATLRFLPQDKAIHFAVRAKDRAGNQTLTADYTFVTTGATGTPAPSLVFSATPSSVSSGQATTLSWTASDATSCTASGAWSGAKSLSGTLTTAALTSNTTFTLSCIGPGGSVSKSAIVTLMAAASGATLTLTAPALGASVPADAPLRVTYAAGGNLAGADHVVLRLDSGTEVQGSGLNGTFEFAHVDVGAHTVYAYLATSSNAKISGTDAQTSFSATGTSTSSANGSGGSTAPGTASGSTNAAAAGGCTVSESTDGDWMLPLLLLGALCYLWRMRNARAPRPR